MDSRDNRVFCNRDITWSNFRFRSFYAQSIEHVEKPINLKFHLFSTFPCRVRRCRSLLEREKQEVSCSSPQPAILSPIILSDVSFDRELSCAPHNVLFKSEKSFFLVRNGRFVKSNELENLVFECFRADTALGSRPN